MGKSHRRSAMDLASIMSNPAQPATASTGTSPAASLSLIATDEEILAFLGYHQAVWRESGGQRADKLSADDMGTLTQYFRFDFLAQAYSQARSIELHSQPSYMLTAATRKLYAGAVRRLATADQNGDPYNQFAMLTAALAANPKEKNGNAYYQSKAALNREAARVMLDELPQILDAFVAFLKRASAQMIKQDRSHAERMAIAEAFRLKCNAHSEWRRQHYHAQQDVDNLEKPSEISIKSLLEIARAAKFLTDFPPDLHGVRSRAGYHLPRGNDRSRHFVSKDPAKHDLDLRHDLVTSQTMSQKMYAPKAKRPVLARLGRIESRKRKRDQNYEWRTAIWSEALRDKHTNDTQRALIAVQIALGPRPIEIALGVTIHLLRAENAADDDRILVRMTGAKTSDATYFDDEHPKYRKTSADLAAIAQLKADPQVMEFNTKGQPWKLFELDCAYPETRWLADYVHQIGLPMADNYCASLSADEAAALHPFLRAISHTVFVQHNDQHGDPVADPGQTAEVLRTNAAISFSKLLARLGRRAFPRLTDRITSYVYRHALASDLKAAGVEQAEISKTIGHISGRTAARYGSALHAKSRLYGNRAFAIRSRTTANVVRNTQAPVPRFSGNCQKHS